MHNPSPDFLLNVTAALHMELDLIPKEKEDTAAMENLYELRLYDTPVPEFKLMYGTLKKDIVEILKKLLEMKGVVLYVY